MLGPPILGDIIFGSLMISGCIYIWVLNEMGYENLDPSEGVNLWPNGSFHKESNKFLYREVLANTILVDEIFSFDIVNKSIMV